MNAGGEPGHAIAEPVQRGGEEEVVLMAVAAPSPPNELPLEAVRVESDGSPEGDVEVLERHRRHVSAVERGQGRPRRNEVTPVPESIQVGSHIEPPDAPLRVQGGLAGARRGSADHGPELLTNDGV